MMIITVFKVKAYLKESFETKEVEKVFDLMIKLNEKEKRG